MKKQLLFIIFIFSFLQQSFSQTAPGIEWQNTIGGNFEERLYSVKQTNDGGYILGGHSRSGIYGDKTEINQGNDDYWVIKLDPSGNIEWQNTIGGIYLDYLFSVLPTTDGGYILGGNSTSPMTGDKTEPSQGWWDYWIIKLDSIGNIKWQNTIGGDSVDQVYPNSVIQTNDGGYFIGGSSSSDISGDKTENSLGERDFWILKLDTAGNIEWQNTIGGNLNDNLSSVQETADGGYILGGASESNISGDKTENSQGYFDYWVVKIDSAGDIQWQNTIGGSYDDYLHTLQLTSDGGYMLAGESYSGISGDKTENAIGATDIWVIKLDVSGNIQWQNTIGGSDHDHAYSVKQTADGGFILATTSSSNISGDKTENCIGWHDYWVIKLNAYGNILWQNTIGGAYDDALYSIQLTSDNGYILGGLSASNISGDKTENSIGQGSDYWIIKLLPDTTTSITQFPDYPNTFSLYPNPAKEYVNINYQFKAGDEIRLTDVLGKLLFTTKITVPTLNFKLQTLNLSTGIYFLKAGNEVRKFVKE